jgi:hypothetical protein
MQHDQLSIMADQLLSALKLGALACEPVLFVRAQQDNARWMVQPFLRIQCAPARKWFQFQHASIKNYAPCRVHLFSFLS